MQDDLELVMETDVAFASTYVAHHGHNRHPSQTADAPATEDVRDFPFFVASVF